MTGTTTELDIRLKRAYEAPSQSDGTRILVDRLWPRGVAKDKAAIDHWFREIAPSTELRRWFGHEASRWAEFRRRYADEIKRHKEQLDELVRLARHGRITLVFAARDEEHNDAVVLREMIRDHAKHQVHDR